MNGENMKEKLFKAKPATSGVLSRLAEGVRVKHHYGIPEVKD